MPQRPPVYKPLHHRTTQERQQANDKQRGTAAQRGYGSKWRKARAVWLAQYPLCVYCYKDGLTVAATELDHIQPHKGSEKLFWDFENNVQSLCRHHHSKKTATEDGGFGNMGK